MWKILKIRIMFLVYFPPLTSRSPIFVFHMCFAASLVPKVMKILSLLALLFSVSNFPKDSEFKLPKWTRSERVHFVFENVFEHVLYIHTQT